MKSESLDSVNQGPTTTAETILQAETETDSEEGCVDDRVVWVDENVKSSVEAAFE